MSQLTNCCQLLRICCEVISVSSSRFPAENIWTVGGGKSGASSTIVFLQVHYKYWHQPVLDPVYGDIVAEDGVDDLVQLVRVMDRCVKGEFLQQRIFCIQFVPDQFRFRSIWPNWITWPLGPFAWTLYCQKYLSFFEPDPPASSSSIWTRVNCTSILKINLESEASRRFSSWLLLFGISRSITVPANDD